MASISEYSLNNTGAEVQKAIDDSLINLPYQINQKVSITDVLTKNNTTAYTPTSDYHPATKAYADSLRPNITVGTTTTGAAGTRANVTNSGTSQDAILNFTIPQGVRGYWVNRVARTSGTGAAGTTDTYTMYINDTNSTAVGTFNVYNGTDASISVGLNNVTDSSLTITGSPLTKSGTISIRHTNAITAQTTRAVYPITIDRSGHISGYGSAVSIGDMFKSTYDTNNNGIVDKADHLDNNTNQLYFIIE